MAETESDQFSSINIGSYVLFHFTRNEQTTCKTELEWWDLNRIRQHVQDGGLDDQGMLEPVWDF